MGHIGGITGQAAAQVPPSHLHAVCMRLLGTVPTPAHPNAAPSLPASPPPPPPCPPGPAAGGAGAALPRPAGAADGAAVQRQVVHPHMARGPHRVSVMAQLDESRHGLQALLPHSLQSVCRHAVVVINTTAT